MTPAQRACRIADLKAALANGKDYAADMQRRANEASLAGKRLLCQHLQRSVARIEDSGDRMQEELERLEGEA